jgi:tRNA (guanosine-2'-O-)-methyltransferase
MTLVLPSNLSFEVRQQILNRLLPLISENKQNKFNEFIKSRTRYLTIVLEDIFQPHNASAVLRSCDCFGIQDVHIIENQNQYEVNPDVALGSAKWLTLKKYNQKENNTHDCLHALKNKGYRIVATTPHQDDFSPDALPLDQPTALLFGTELEGLTPEALKMADSFVRIPMVGFTESLNISVSAAILLYVLSGRIRQSDMPWQLPQEEILDIHIQWAASVVKKPELIIHDLIA